MKARITVRDRVTGKIRVECVEISPEQVAELEALGCVISDRAELVLAKRRPS
jgi:hypothetical protein